MVSKVVVDVREYNLEGGVNVFKEGLKIPEILMKCEWELLKVKPFFFS